MAELREILSHPDFINLPDNEKQKALTELLPGFGDLPQAEQQKGLTEIMGRMQQPIASPQPQPFDPMAESLGMFQPENIAPSMETIKEQAPIAGAMITAPFKMNPMLAPIAGMGASAAALMAGQGSQPMMQGETPDIMGASLGQFNAPGDPFLMGAGGELGGQAVLKGIEKFAAPYAKSFMSKLASSPETQAAQELVEQGVPLSPGGYAGAKRFQWLADNFMPGSLIVNKRREEVSNAILKMRQEFIEDAMDLPKFTESIPQSKAKTRELFDKFKGELGPDPTVTIPMPNAVKFIEENSFSKLAQSDPKKWWTKRLLPWAQGGEAKTLSEINSLNASYNRYWNLLTPDQRKLRQGLHDAYLKDLVEWDMATGFKVEKALTTAQESAKHTYDISKARWIEQSLLNPATDNIGESLVFSPLKFKEQINKNLTRIEQMFGQSGLDIINKFADKVSLASPDISKLGKVSDATTKFRQISGVGLLGPAGLVASGQPGMGALLAVPYGFQTIAAKSLMNPEGWLRKWLTTGLKPPTLVSKEIPKLGIMEATND